MALPLQQKQAVLQHAKSTINVQPFSSWPVPANDQECSRQLAELLNLFNAPPPAGVMPTNTGGSGFGTPGQSEAIFGK